MRPLPLADAALDLVTKSETIATLVLDEARPARRLIEDLRLLELDADDRVWRASVARLHANAKAAATVSACMDPVVERARTVWPWWRRVVVALRILSPWWPRGLRSASPAPGSASARRPSGGSRR